MTKVVCDYCGEEIALGGAPQKWPTTINREHNMVLHSSISPGYVSTVKLDLEISINPEPNRSGNFNLCGPCMIKVIKDILE